jgi:hypothetical protein
MKVIIKIPEEENAGTANNYEFVSSENMKYSLCSIPPFIENTKCDCGEPAKIMLNNEMYKCNICLALLIPQNKLKITMDVATPIMPQTIKKMRFVWAGHENAETWYNLWGNTIETKNWNAIVKAVKTMIITKKSVEFDGEYIPKTNTTKSKMIIY